MATTFFDANGNYYETLTDREAPEGHTVAPAKPGPDYEWSGGQWVSNPPAVTLDQVKAEAQRRILALCPEWKQRNLTAQAVILAKKGASNWTPEEQAAWDDGEALWTQIAAIRAASDAIEQLDPIPQDFTDDSYWP